MSFERAQLRRLMELDERIRRGEYPNAASFAAAWEVSRRTVLRDLDMLRDLGAPLEYSAERRGFRYARDSWRMPALDLSEGELLELVLAQRLAEQYRGTPIGERLDGLFRKVRAALPQPVRVDPVLVSGFFSFHGQPVRRVAEKIWTTLARCVRERRAARAEYRGFGRERSEALDLEPLHLACIEGEWYLVARRSGSSDLRHFAVSRFTRVQSLARSFAEAGFDPARYFENRFGRFVGPPGDVEKVVVRFAAAEAEGVLERQWHPHERVERARDGRVTLEFPAPSGSLYAVRRWVLQWGRAADVLAPKALRDDVRAELGLAPAGRRLTRSPRTTPQPRRAGSRR